MEWHNVVGLCTKAAPPSKKKKPPLFLPCFAHYSSTYVTGFYFILFNFVFLW